MALHGVNMVLISQPYVNKKGAIDNYNFLSERGMLTRNADGGTHDVTTWVGDAGMLDVSNPDTHHVEGNAAPVIVKVQGLRAEANYRMHLNMDGLEDMPEEAKEWFMKCLPYGYKEGETISGAALQQCGLVIPGAMEEYQAWQIHIGEA